MNRFQVNAGFEPGFERTWRERDRHLDAVPGFLAFRLLRGEAADGVTVFLSHSTWASQDAFLAWTQSDAFKAAHGKARSPKGTLSGHPTFSGYDVVLNESRAT